MNIANLNHLLLLLSHASLMIAARSSNRRRADGVIEVLLCMALAVHHGRCDGEEFVQEPTAEEMNALLAEFCRRFVNKKGEILWDDIISTRAHLAKGEFMLDPKEALRLATL
jgi:hypothetical protein